MKRLIIAALAGVCVLMGAIGVFADENMVLPTNPAEPTLDSSYLITEAHVYTANLYYCDHANSKVVLKNVKPMGVLNDQSQRTAAEAEYSEIWISSGDITLTDGTKIKPEAMNHYIDSNLRVVITRSPGEGIRVVKVNFL